LDQHDFLKSGKQLEKVKVVLIWSWLFFSNSSILEVFL